MNKLNKSPIIIGFHGGPGSGKCFAPGTMILMSDLSLKKIEDIDINDYIMGIDSKPKRVLSKHNGIDEMFLIHQDKGIDYVVNSMHEICLQRTKGSRLNNRLRFPELTNEIIITPIEYIKKSKKFQRCFKGYKVKNSFDEQEIFIDPYYLGLWLGDVDSRNTRICSADNEILEYCDFYAKSIGLKTTINRKKIGIAKTISLVKNEEKNNRPNVLKEKLKFYNLLENKHIPIQYLVNSEKNRLELLAGLIDSAGGRDGETLNITFKNKKLADDTYRLCNSLGFKVSCSKRFKKCCNNGKIGVYYSICINGYLNNIPIKLPRKKVNPINRNNPYQTGISVKSIGIGTYYGVEVEDSLMLLEDNTVVHNSTLASRVFTELKELRYNVEFSPEFAKDLTWEESFGVLSNQLLVFATQQHGIFRLKEKVDIIVTDSPLILSLVYGEIYLKDDMSKNFKNLIIEEFNRYPRFDVFVERAYPYDEKGRNQKLEDAIKIDERIKEIYKENDWEFDMSIKGHKEAGEKVITQMIKKFM